MRIDTMKTRVLRVSVDVTWDQLVSGVGGITLENAWGDNIYFIVDLLKANIDHELEEQLT